MNYIRLRRCCLPCKGTNFLANHNYEEVSVFHKSDVVYHANLHKNPEL